MRQRSDEFMDALLSEDAVNESDSITDKLAQLEENMNKRIDEMQTELFNKLDVSRETSTASEETGETNETIETIETESNESNESNESEE